MAFITQKNATEPCYSCSKHCIDLEFCASSNAIWDSDGLSSLGYTFTRNMRVKIIANPVYWGFGTKETNVLISGWATYNESNYDFFDGFDEDHKGYKDCGTSFGYFNDEQRPDVIFRSVYDPDTGLTVHYDESGNPEATGGAGRGGAEVYLIDRSGGQYFPISGDQESCSTNPPHQSFRTFPENFGWGNKINFNNRIFRNISGAWRLSSIENCYETHNRYKPSGYLVNCSGEERQNILYPVNRYEQYEPTIIKGKGTSLYPQYDKECLPDGVVAGEYGGIFEASGSIFRNIEESPFITARLVYASGMAASGLRNGMTIGIDVGLNCYATPTPSPSGSEASMSISPFLLNNTYTIFGVTHLDNGTTTQVKFVGTSTGNIPFSNWNSDTHQIEYMPTGDFSVDIPLNSGHWIAFNTLDPQTCCGLAAYGVSDVTKQSTSNYHSDFRRVFNNPKNVRQSNRDKEWRYTYNLYPNGIDPIKEGIRLDYSYPSISGVEKDGQVIGFPIIVSGGQHVVVTGSGSSRIEDGYALFQKEKAYYGLFLETDKYDTTKRLDSQRINRGKGKNGTCYSKQATLEIFPDCYTQYDYYEHCVRGFEYTINRLPRLAFVYRGCDFHDDCSFSDDDRPLGAWKDQGNVPTGINDLKRLLAGQEIHMFLNLRNAWGGRHSNELCKCAGYPNGYVTPRHVQVRSPMRYPGFPNYDLYPYKYGCAEPRHQIQSIINLELLNVPQPSEYCDPLHVSPNVCRARQPYTTYGYMLNLCGKRTNDRRSVIEAFNNVQLGKGYTNITDSGIVEPMFWEVIAPQPAPYGGGGSWGSGSKAFDEDGNPIDIFNQIGGQGYSFWGLADQFGNVVAPYFCTQQSTNLCGTDPDGEIIAVNVDFSVTGTFQNLLNTDTGWPTDAVPFLIELEVEEGCNSCPSTVMDTGNLVIEISGLPGEFYFHNQANYFTDYGSYGYNHCKYGPTIQGAASFGKAKYDMKPPFSCDTGFSVSTCEGSGADAADVWASYTGNTCECMNGFSTVLYPKVVPSSQLVLGWTSNPAGNGAGLIDIGCSDLSSSYFSVGYDEKVNGGYRIWGQFDLACGSLLTALFPAAYPDAKYENDPISAFWTTSTCGHKYPAGNTDLTLQTTLWMIDVRHENIFRQLSAYALKRIAGMNLGNGVLYPPSPMNFWGGQESNYFGSCPGDYIYTYGCKPEGTYFYGEQDDEGRYAGNYEVCASSTPCTTCPVGTGPGDVTCVCGFAAGYEGVVPHPMPLLYQLNECDCLCSTPHLLAKYQIDSNASGMTLVDDYGNDTTRATAYWMSYGSTGPTLIVQGPPAPYMGIRLKYGGGSETNWHDWSHGINGIVNGITHDLYRPYRGRDYLLAGTECNQLTVDHQLNLGHQPNCEANTGCAVDHYYYSGTCGVPIYSTGVNFLNTGYPVRKKKCAPEIAIVTKLDRVGGGYKLTVAREYHEHDRTWYDQRVVGTGDEAEMICVPVNQGAYEYNDGTSSGCYLMPYASLVDTRTPLSNWPCSIHPSSGLFVNQDYQYTATGLTYDSGVFPSGSHTWNYYNLFYKNGFEPTVKYGQIKDSTYFNEEKGTWHCTGVPESLHQEIDGKTILTPAEYNNPAGFDGIFATIGKHSCVQDGPQCGGDMWCNKLFFPRHNYRAGTLIAPFGASQICTATSRRVTHLQEYGYREYFFDSASNTPSVGIIPEAEGVLSEMTNRFVDFCAQGATQQSLYNIGIDDTEIYVSDYLPLMGVIHPGFRYTTDMRSCSVATSGSIPYMPKHSEFSISAGIFAPKSFETDGIDSMGYYLDAHRLTYSGGSTLRAANVNDECLFNPFKILIDVECNTNRIRRKDVPKDSPTFLQGVQNWDARACLGIIGNVACGCGATHCKYASKGFEGTCIGFRVAEYEAYVSSDASGACYCNAAPVGEWYYEGLLANPTGITETEPRCCIGCTECPGVGKWVADPCGTSGRILRVGNPLSEVKMWQCDTYQYLHDHPNEFGLFPTGCACAGKYTEGLCEASWRCTDYTSCSCNPVSSGQQFIVNTPTSGNLSEWWADGDCHCDKSPQDDYGGVSKCRDSLIKWTITEQ